MAKLTIGMAHHEDYDGVYFTIQSLRLYHAHMMQQVEIVVVDNSPESQAGKMVSGLVRGNAAHGTAGTKYVAMHQPIGTSVSRERIFREASAPNVLVLDCHVLLMPGAIERLIAWYASHPGTGDLYSGPLVLDNLSNFSTHFDDTWRSEMWGIWGSAWQCGCGKDGVRFATTNRDNKLGYRLLAMGDTPITMCGSCERTLPQLDFGGHEPKLQEAGYVRLASRDDHEPFPIPGMGLGLFSCRKDAWLGFNEHARGFGGEELYIHEKFRQAGQQAICLPWLRWVHRFGRANGVKYPLTRWNKIRNYVLEFNELGLDRAPVYDHFVGGKLMTEEGWKHLVADPIAHEREPSGACNTCGGGSGGKQDIVSKAGTLEEVYTILHKIPRDLDQHMPKLRELAANCEHVTEMSHRRESTVALLSGEPKRLRSYNTEIDGVFERLPVLAPECRVEVSRETSDKIESIEETDLLFIDTQHTYKRMKMELERFGPKVKRYIVAHDTKLHGEKGEDGGAGLLPAMREFMKANPKWSVVYHTNNQYGLTALSCDKRDKPKLPSKITMAANLAKAAGAYVASGMENASQQVLEGRLEVCSLCDQRVDDRCSVCGCFIAAKAAMKAQQCPLGKWAEADAKVSAEGQ